MNILILTQYFYPENFRINELTAELIKRGHTISVLTGIPNYPIGKTFQDFRRHPGKFDCYSGATIYRVPILVRGEGAFQLFLNYISFIVSGCLFGPWKLRGKEFNAIFVFQPSPVTVGLPAILLGKIKRAPVVIWVLDLWPETLAALDVVSSPRVLSWIGQIVKFIYDSSTLVLGQSYSFIDSISKHCKDKDKIRYFPNWADEIFYEPNLLPAPEVPKLEDAFNILFTGNIGEAQDLPAILETVELLRHNVLIRFLIVGDGRKLEWLRKEVQCRKLHNNILLLGRFPVERMPSFYLHAHALLVSLKKDPVFSMTIPGKVQSYLMARLPIIGMIDGEGSRIITDANAGLVCSAGNPICLASAIIKIASMSEMKRRQFAINGQNYAQKKFSRSLLISQLEALILEAILIYKNKEKARR